MSTLPPSDSVPESRRKPLPKGRRGKKDRHRRFQANRKTRVEIGGDDRVLLRLIDRHRLIDSRQLWLALGGGKNFHAFLRRLQWLFHAEYLDRPPAQVRPGHPMRHMVYALGWKGHRELYPKLWEKGRPRDFRLENRRLKLHHLEHEVAVAETLLTLHVAAEGQGWSFVWSKGEEFHEKTGFPERIEIEDVAAGQGGKAGNAGQGARTLPLNPDAYVTVGMPGHTVNWFVEIDMSTEPQVATSLRRSSIRQKLIAYWSLHQSRLRKYDRRHTSFRVLFVTTTDVRLENMRKVAQVVDPKGRGPHFFHFSTLDRVRIENASAVFAEPRWWSAKQGYDNARKLFLDLCPRCHQLVDPANEPHVVVNSEPPGLAFAPASTPIAGVLPEEPQYAHRVCPGR